jgi:hypothetical protein
MAEPNDVQIVKVYGDKHAKDRTHPAVAFERRIYTREITFTCERCKALVTEWHYPGKTPYYCETCSPIMKREKTAARVRRARNKKQRQERSSPTDL